jgi:hypothetical protein
MPAKDLALLARLVGTRSALADTAPLMVSATAFTRASAAAFARVPRPGRGRAPAGRVVAVFQRTAAHP